MFKYYTIADYAGYLSIRSKSRVRYRIPVYIYNTRGTREEEKGTEKRREMIDNDRSGNKL